MALFVALTLGILSAFSLFASLFLAAYSAVESPLATLFITGARETMLETGIFLTACSIIIISYIRLIGFRSFVKRVIAYIHDFIYGLPKFTRTILFFLLATLFIFSLNSQGIIRGYFHSDDFAMTMHASTYSMGELIWMPYSDHAMPLNWVETKSFYDLFSTNPIPYNIFLLVIAAGLTFLGYLLLRELGYGDYSLLILFALFGSTVILSEFLSGFYALAIYPQVTILFLLSLLMYLKSERSTNKKTLFAYLSLMFLGMSIFFDISGIWTPIAYILFVYTYGVAEKNELSPINFIKSKWKILGGAIIILITYGSYLIRLYSTQTAPFAVGTNTLSLDVFKQLYDVYTAGVIAQFFLPSAGLIVSQPRFLEFLTAWNILMALFLLSIALITYLVIKNGDRATRAYGMFFLSLVLGTGLLVALGRPTSHPAAFFPVQQIAMPFFWMAIFLTIAACTYLRTSFEKVYIDRLFLVIGLCIVVVSAQHVFSFYNKQNLQEVTDSKSAVSVLQNKFVPTINNLAEETEGLFYVPNLRGQYINPFLFGRDTNQYKAFLNLSDNVRLIGVRNGPYHASTSASFIEALKTNSNIRYWYTKPIEVEVGYNKSYIENDISINLEGENMDTAVLSPKKVSPVSQYILNMDFSAENAPEKIYINLTFKNDFSTEGENAIVRIDQYSKMLTDSKNRRYSISVDLNQVYTFALSETVSDFTISFNSPGSYTIHGYQFVAD